MEDNFETYSSTSASSGSNPGSSSLAYDKVFLCSLPGILTLIEIVFGLPVWMLIGGTEYIQVPGLVWVLLVAVGCWVITLCLLLAYLTSITTRYPLVPWNKLGLCFNCSAAVLYMTSACVDAAAVTQAYRGRHSYNSWMASTIFAYIVAVCYTVSACLNFKTWKNQKWWPILLESWFWKPQQSARLQVFTRGTSHVCQMNLWSHLSLKNIANYYSHLPESSPALSTFRFSE